MGTVVGRERLFKSDNKNLSVGKCRMSIDECRIKEFCLILIGKNRRAKRHPPFDNLHSSFAIPRSFIQGVSVTASQRNGR